MDYKQLIHKLECTSKRVRQLEVIKQNTANDVDAGEVDKVVYNIISESIDKINSIYNIKTGENKNV